MTRKKSLSMLLALVALLLVLTACEKEIIEDDDAQEPAATTHAVSTIEKARAKSVAEVLQMEDGSEVCIKAYIVGSTTRSMSNFDHTSPFTGSTAIVLADFPADGSVVIYDDEVMPVCLTDCSKKIRAALNLEDNPQLWNRQIYITATKGTYLRVSGLRKVKEYELSR